MDTATAATDMATVMDTATARGRLSLLPLLRLPLSPDMDTAMDMVTDTVTGTAMDMATAATAADTVTGTATDTDTVTGTATDTATARGRLLLSPDTDTMATMDTAMDTVMDTDMATDTAMATATMDREGTDCVSNHDVKSSVKA